MSDTLWQSLTRLAGRSAVVPGLLLLLLAGCHPATPASTSAAPSPVPPPNALATLARFVDRAGSAGIAFVPTNGAEADRKTILETLGVGVAMLDFDEDGDVDLVFPGGGKIGTRELLGRAPALFRNVGDWRFEEVTVPAQLVDTRLYTHGAAAGDYDGDGFGDLLITGFQGLRLYRNQGDGTFQDVTAAAGLTHQAWSTSAAWGDLNGDSILDLYVVNYVDWSLDNNPPCIVEWGDGSLQVEDTCGPEKFEAQSDWLFLGDGAGRLHEAGAAAGLVAGGKGLAVLLADVDHDSRLDIYVANDGTPNFLYRNQGQGRFAEVGAFSGTALGDRGRADGSMGVDLGDYDRDGRPDLWVTNYEEQSMALYRNAGETGDAVFEHVSYRTGITAVGLRYVGFGTCFLDFDHDGDEDLFVANGHVKQQARYGPFEQLPLLFENLAGRQFVNVASQSGAYTAAPHMGRGVAAGDLDNDGDIDLAVAHTNQPVAVLANESKPAGHWLMIRLVGYASHRDAVGGRIVLRTAAGTQTRYVKGGSSYLSTSDSRLHFGLASDDTIDRIEIHWPSGHTQALTAVAPNQRLVVQEGRAGFETEMD